MKKAIVTLSAMLCLAYVAPAFASGEEPLSLEYWVNGTKYTWLTDSASGGFIEGPQYTCKGGGPDCTVYFACGSGYPRTMSNVQKIKANFVSDTNLGSWDLAYWDLDDDSPKFVYWDRTHTSCGNYAWEADCGKETNDFDAWFPNLYSVTEDGDIGNWTYGRGTAIARFEWTTRHPFWFNGRIMYFYMFHSQEMWTTPNGYNCPLF